MVNAKRMGAEIGRRLSATLEAAPSAATAPATPAGSAAPAATAPAANSSTGKATQRQTGSDGGAGGLDDAHRAMTMSLSDSRNPFEKTVGGGERGGKVEAAADLLARVRDQLERSEQRTKGLLVESPGVGDIAPPR